MQVELYIRGELFHTWEFGHAVYYEALCEVSHEEQKELWIRILQNCKREVEPIIARYSFEIHVVVPARIQPADIDAEEYEAFLPVVIEIENRLNLKYD